MLREWKGKNITKKYPQYQTNPKGPLYVLQCDFDGKLSNGMV